MKKIVFMGTPEYASEILAALLCSKYEVVAVFTQPDKPVGRKMILTPPDVKKFILDGKINIPIFQPVNLKNTQIVDEIKALNPDFIVVAAYGQILPKSILDIAPCINLHASILPEFRGASPIQASILSEQNFSGVTAMRMAQGLDNGDMLAFSVLEISNLGSKTLFKKLSKMAATLIVKTLDNFDKISPIPQFDAISSKCAKIKKEDGLISLNQSAKDICLKFRAYEDWPGVFLENKTKIFDLKQSNLSGNIGEILSINSDSFVVGTKENSIEISFIQEVGKNKISAKDYVNGKRLIVGSKFC